MWGARYASIRRRQRRRFWRSRRPPPRGRCWPCSGCGPMANITQSAAELIAARQTRREARAGPLDGRDLAAGEHPDAVLLHIHAQMLPHVVVEAAQDVFAAIDQRHLRAEPGKNAGELDGDIAAALDQDMRAADAADGTPRSRRWRARYRGSDRRSSARRRWRSGYRPRAPDCRRQLHRVGVGEHAPGF